MEENEMEENGMEEIGMDENVGRSQIHQAEKVQDFHERCRLAKAPF